MSSEKIRSDTELLLEVVRFRFRAQRPNAIVCAIEGLMWLAGDEESVVDRKSLQLELEEWEQWERQRKYAAVRTSDDQ